MAGSSEMLALQNRTLTTSSTSSLRNCCWQVPTASPKLDSKKKTFPNPNYESLCAVVNKTGRSGLKYVIANSRNGRDRWYFKPPYQKKIRIWEAHEYPEFLERAAALLRAFETGGELQEAPARLTITLSKPKTFRWLCEQFFKSAVYKQKKARAQRLIKARLKSCCQEPIAPKSDKLFADYPLEGKAGLDLRGLAVLRDRKAVQGLPEAANNKVRALKELFSWAADEERKLIPADIAAKLKRIKNKSDGWNSLGHQAGLREV